MLGLHRDGSFCDLVNLPAQAVRGIPDTMTFKQAAYMEPIAASLAVLNARIDAAEQGIIYGNNRIAELALRVMRAHGYDRVTIYDPDRDGPLPEDGYDFIIESVATSDALQEMIRGVRPGGRIVLKSRQWKPLSVPVGDLVRKDIGMTAVHYGDFDEGIRLVAAGRLQVDDLFGEVRPLEDYESMFHQARSTEAKKLFLSSTDEGLRDQPMRSP